MTLDSALLYRPTECLVLQNHRKFFPIRIPNAHHQLRHYISTADPDRIYVAVERQIYVFHIPTRKREKIAVVPFSPRCLTAGLGWIGIGGSEHGDCAFIKIGETASGTPPGMLPPRTDVDSPLPVDLDPSRPRYPPSSANIKIHEFGGSIVNSVTLHRLPALNNNYANEDVAVLSNNDTTVSIYSLTRSEMIQSIRHPICMNYAIISPDSNLLAAVGDANHIYFYRIEQSPENRVPVRNSDKMLMGWNWPLIRSVELDTDPEYDDCCCFTIAFSPSSHLCAVGSQAGIITVFDVKSILTTDPEDVGGREHIVCVFQSSRSYFEGGAVRSMSFSPRPWDLLVWVEDYGRAGVADIRQAFSRRQILSLDLDEPGLQIVRTHIGRDDQESSSDSDGAERFLEHEGLNHRENVIEATSLQRDQQSGDSETELSREELLREMGYRERHIIDSVNASEWDDGILSSRIPRRLSPESLMEARTGNRSPRASSPGLADAVLRAEYGGDRQLERVRATVQPPTSRPSISIAQPQGERLSSTLLPAHGINPSSITLRWTQSPARLQPSDYPSDADGSNATGRSGAAQSTNNEQPNGNGNANGPTSSRQLPRARVLFNRSPENPASPLSTQAQQVRLHRTRSIPRRADRLDHAVERQEGQTIGSTPEERSRLRRQAVIEEGRRTGVGAPFSHYRRRIEVGQLRAPRWARMALGDDGRYGSTSRERERGLGTAGIGWGADGRTLFIGTVEGIFQLELNVQDRKTFPGFSCR
ncbi:WD repeat domain-containing protein [Histoplasma capsulatum var. duboisii H88]|uniref:WD repeat domain-containing protein n=1 Tax=Ajellomyces capsulatus (strain H88) TaxID=544711 RepID=A0A8A1LCT2_AJEC8|nr:WD repeat domain-containing protein [Histoplasma capsulatum var. duboisii H88]